MPKISYTAFTLNFSAMSALKPLVSRGKGNVAAILPDTVSSTRYVEFDAPYLKKAMTLAGLPSSDIIIQNALGSDATRVLGRPGRHHQRRDRPDHGPARLRGRGQDRVLRQVARRGR